MPSFLRFASSLLTLGLLCPMAVPAQKSPVDEREIVRELTELRSQVAELQARIEKLLKALESSEVVAVSPAPARASATSSAAMPASPSAPTAAVTRTRCAATTNKGLRCSRRAKPGIAFCWQHEQ